MTLNTVKGFLDNIEGNELAKIARKCYDLGPCLEIGTYCGKSALIIGEACKKTNNLLFTIDHHTGCLLYTSPSPRDLSTSRMPSSA